MRLVTLRVKGRARNLESRIGTAGIRSRWLNDTVRAAAKPKRAELAELLDWLNRTAVQLGVSYRQGNGGVSQKPLNDVLRAFLSEAGRQSLLF